ncbi:hypothetical protein LTR22_027676 [Elasticomyces elasticus]|nr:hypothetical protein LTR22_027676 [Elasticomyces elasticus]
MEGGTDEKEANKRARAEFLALSITSSDIVSTQTPNEFSKDKGNQIRIHGAATKSQQNPNKAQEFCKVVRLPSVYTGLHFTAVANEYENL